jgi:hypothetical protein
MLFKRGAATDDVRARREAQFGPLSDAVTNFGGVMRAGYSELHTTSLLCAACHQHSNDHDFDGDYLEPGSVPADETYSEWLASPYASSRSSTARSFAIHLKFIHIVSLELPMNTCKMLRPYASSLGARAKRFASPSR